MGREENSSHKREQTAPKSEEENFEEHHIYLIMT